MKFKICFNTLRHYFFSIFPLALVAVSQPSKASPCAKDLSLKALNQFETLHYSFSKKEHARWELPSGSIKGYSLAVHGLNNSAKIMDPIIETLSTLGIASLRITLPGHSSTGPQFSSNRFSNQDWTNQVLKSFCLVKEKARQSQVPSLITAYSLGALTSLRVLQNNSNLQPSLNIFFAPAISFTTKVNLFKGLFLFGGIQYPSFNPSKKHMVHKYLSGYAYKAFFKMHKAYHSNPKPNIGSYKTLVFLHPKDELVSFTKSEKWIENLPNWALHKVSNHKAVVNFNYNHLITSESMVGQQEWSKITSLISDNLKASVVKSPLPGDNF